MYTEIDSSEIIVYLACKSIKEHDFVEIEMSKVHQLGDYLEDNNESIIVNLGSHSIVRFCNYNPQNISINQNKIRLQNLSSQAMKFLMRQYMPSAEIIKKIEQLQ